MERDETRERIPWLIFWPLDCFVSTWHSSILKQEGTGE